MKNFGDHADFTIAPPGVKLTEYTDQKKRESEIQRKQAMRYSIIERRQYPGSLALGKVTSKPGRDEDLL